MKIQKDFFKEIDREEEKEKLLGLQSDIYALKSIAELFTSLTYKKFGVLRSFIRPNMKPKTLEKKYKQIKRLVKICAELGMDYSTYILSQFELLAYWLKKSNRTYVPFEYLITDNAVKRIEGFDTTRVEEKKVKRAKELNYVIKLTDNVEQLYKRLLIVREHVALSDEEVAKEVEMLFRAGQLNDFYVWSLSANVQLSQYSEALDQIISETDVRLSVAEKEEISKTHNSIRKDYLDKEVVEYV